MVTLLLDTSNILFRSMFAAQGYGSDQFTYDSEDECGKLMRKLCTDCAHIIRNIKPSRVIFCKDSRTVYWRKLMFIEENEGYKGQRVKDKRINWDNVYHILDEFLNVMLKNGYCLSHITGNKETGGAEGDDCIAMWANELFNRGERVVIVSGDEDVRQLVKTSQDNKFSFVAVFNPFKHGKNGTKKLYHGKGMIEWLNAPSIVSLFEMYVDGDKDDFRKIYEEKEIAFEYVNGNEIPLQKILCGDESDNIPAFYTWSKVTAKGKDATDRITPAKYRKIVEELKLTCVNDLDSIEQLEKLQVMIEGFAKKPMTCNIFERFNRQRHLVELSPALFPESILEEFEQTKGQILTKPLVTNSGSIRMQDMLKNSIYLTDERYSSDSVKSSVFADFDKMGKLF